MPGEKSSRSDGETPDPLLANTSSGYTPAGQALSSAALFGVLQGMFAEVRQYLLGAGRDQGEQVGTNPKGEATRAFDAEAERRALAYAQAHLPPFRVLSEESGELQIGAGAPQYTLVIDPCDGSNNFRRGVRSVGFAVAVLPGSVAALDPALVQHALVGEVYTGAVYTASRGEGAKLDGRPIRASAITELRQATLCINFGRVRPATSPGDVDDHQDTPLPESIWRLARQLPSDRRFGATVIDLCYVAQGAFEGYVDLRSRLTPENFLAPALVITEAGGLCTDAHGLPLGPVEFTTGYCLLAAGNHAMLQQIVEALA